LKQGGLEGGKVQDARVQFPIVGIGASAGGLVALQQFLSHISPSAGMAYVIVQHLDPDRDGMLVELLQRHTAMPVAQALDQAPIESDHVYVIPPGRDLSILDGVLHLLDPLEPRGLRLPIDFFFRSLALDRKQDSIGVILSGMGSDGTLGLRAIKQGGGACFVQTPASAQFDGMPRSAINAGVADVLAPAEELPLRILDYVKRTRCGVDPASEESVDRAETGFFEKAVILLHAQSGHDFSQYKKSTLMRRIERRMALHQLSRPVDYLRYLRENPHESELLFNELLIGVTGFFRDAPVWEQLKTEVIPALLAMHPQGAALRAWVPACSTGEEAYSLAMIFKETLEEMKVAQRYSLQIFASDLDKEAIATARAGIYPRAIASEVPAPRLQRFFHDDPGGFRVSAELREMLIVAQQNIINDPPFTRIDLLSCRNLMIYLEPALQGKLIQLFHYSLSAGGFLVLGSAESVGTGSVLFAQLEGKTRIYRRLEAPTHALQLGFPAAFSHAHSKSWGGESGLSPKEAPTLQRLVDRMVLLRYAPAAVLVAPQGEMLYFSGRTGRYLEPAAGKPNMNLFAMARDGLNQALSESFPRAIRDRTLVTLKKVRIVGIGAAHYVDVLIQPLTEPAVLHGLALVVFYDVPAPVRRRVHGASADEAAHDERLEVLAQELQRSREDARAAREEMQTSQEELKSSNEELQSSNEELQSANEELTTSKEELQSMNEELQTVNSELQAKVADLSRASNDMRNLLDSTEIATLFLDGALNVRRFTAQTTRIFKLIATDMGRPITDIVSELRYPELATDAQEVLRTLVFRERDVPATEGRWFRVRVMPYRTHENRIDGLVITFADMTQNKKLERELYRVREQPAAGPATGGRRDGADGLS
jgi:two-component system, chemotaxis family, CheB/CheR fusion protein